MCTISSSAHQLQGLFWQLELCDKEEGKRAHVRAKRTGKTLKRLRCNILRGRHPMCHQARALLYCQTFSLAGTPTGKHQTCHCAGVHDWTWLFLPARLDGCTSTCLVVGPTNNQPFLDAQPFLGGGPLVQRILLVLSFSLFMVATTNHGHADTTKLCMSAVRVVGTLPCTAVVACP